MDVSVIVPMYDEAEAAPTLFDGLRRLAILLAPERACEFVLIDDGSTDATFELAMDFAESTVVPTRVVRLNPNEGIGAALRHGFDFATGTVVVTMDADLTYPLEDVTRLCDHIDAGADVVTASPYMTGGAVEGVPTHRLLISKLCNAAYRVRLLGTARGLRTFTCGFRAYRRSILDRIAPTNAGFLATAQMIVRALRAGLQVEEIPSTLHGRAAGGSKMRVARTTTSHLVYLIRCR